MAVWTRPPEDWKRLASNVAATSGPIAWGWAAERRDGRWRLAAFTVRSGTEAIPRVDRYSSAVIAVETLTPQAAAGRLRRGVVATKRTIAGGLAIAPYTGDVSGVQLSSDEFYASSAPGWPRVLTALNPPDFIQPDSRAMLQDSGQPFYPTLNHALAERLYGISPGDMTRMRPASMLVVLSDRRARLGEFEIDDEGLHVDLERGKGELPPGYRVRVVWRAQSASARVERYDADWRGARSLSIPCEGIPAELTVALVAPSGDVIDQRSWSDLDLLARAPESLAELVSRLLVEGEGARVEFKRVLRDKATKRSFAETVAAFSNASGGVVLVGVADDAEVTGYDAPKVHDQVVNIVREHVLEAVDVTVTRVEIRGHPVVVVQVPAGDPSLKPYRAADRVMIRAGATTRVATTVEHRRLSGAQPDSFGLAFPARVG